MLLRDLHAHFRRRSTPRPSLRLALAAALACLLLASPAPAAPRPATLLDSFLPACHFRNAESVRIQAPPWAVFAAVRAVTASEVQGFVPLGESVGQEIVVGAIGQFWADRYVALRSARDFSTFRDPRFARIAMNVGIRDDGHGGSLVSTETRALCPDPQARRKFAGCWRLWTPGGSLVRTQWLEAVRRRSEGVRRK